ncbi:hypothetical protein LGW00_02130 [Streptococcus mutans]|nr:hypothetical protein [Streptococcus mutans]
MNKNVAIKKSTLFYIILCFIGIFRIALLRSAPWELDANTGYDDLLQLKNAISIASGNWLGKTYSYISMTKNVGYPLFLALTQLLNIPYSVLYGLLISLSSFSFIKAIQPVVKSKKLLLLIFFVIIFTPINHGAFYRIYRNALVPWVLLLIISSYIAIFIRRRNRLSLFLPWTILAFFSIMYFWTLREDSIWILPFILVAAITIIITIVILYKKDLHEILLRSVLVLLPLIGIVVSNVWVSAINYSYYGIWGVNDRSDTAAAKAMSLIYKIEDNQTTDSNVWASRKAFELAIKASPSLRTVGNTVLASYGLWAGKNTDIKGDIAQWAFRFGVEEEGYYHGNGKKTNALYKAIANELGEAFQKGRLKKRDGIYLSTQTGAFHWKDISQSMTMSLDLTNKMFHFYNTNLSSGYIDYPNLTETELISYEDMLNTSLPRTNDQLSAVGITKTYSDYDVNLTSLSNHYQQLNASIFRRRNYYINFQEKLIKCYQVVSYFMFPLSFLAYLILIIDGFRHQFTANNLSKLIILSSLLLTGILNLFIVSLFSRWIDPNTDSFIYGFYAPSAYLLFNLFMCMGGIVLFEKLCSSRMLKNFLSTVGNYMGRHRD